MFMEFTFVEAGVIILRCSPGLVVADDSHHKSHCIELHHDGEFLSAAREWIAIGLGQGLMAKVREWLVWFWGHDVSDNGINLLCTACLLAVSMASDVAFILCARIAIVSMPMHDLLPQSPVPTTFSCRLVLLVPLIGIAANAFMMGSLSALSWALTCM
jgi:hypothetical protein